MQEHDIQQFVDDLDHAGQFEARTTAVDGWHPEEEEPTDVEAWRHGAFTRCLDRYQSLPADPPFGTAVIEDAVRGRTYVQGPCEKGQWFLNRLRREAPLAAEPWLLLVMPAVSGVRTRMWQTWAGTVEARPFPLTWYLEARGRGQALRRWGTATLGTNRSTMEPPLLIDPPPPVLEILRGHPARRRHQIRRR